MLGNGGNKVKRKKKKNSQHMEIYKYGYKFAHINYWPLIQAPLQDKCRTSLLTLPSTSM